MSDQGSLDSSSTAGDQHYRVGTASETITPDPDEPHVLFGFAARPNEPMDGVEQDIHAKAVAVEDANGQCLLLVSVAQLYVRPTQRSMLEDHCAERWDVDPDSIILNPTHTHYAPQSGTRPEDLDDDADEDERRVAAYRTMVDETLRQVVDDAMADCEPATLQYYTAKCGMAMCRRRPAHDGVHFDADPDGPTDHDLPVLTAETGDAEPKAILFGYACHPTVGGGSFNEVSGDWPGFAMQYVEEEHPGTTALFLIGCAGDQKAYPQATREWVRRHARTAAYAVERALVTDTVGARTEPDIVRGPLTTVADETVLDLHEQLEDEDGNPDGVRVEQRRYPMQAVDFGGDLTFLSLSGEVVADISNELKERIEGPVWTAAYANPAGYIVTDRILSEGGSEARSSGVSGMRYARSTEDRVVEAATALAERAGATRR